MLGLIVLLGAATIPSGVSGSPRLATDKADYGPGEVVEITGSGIAAGTYDLPVRRPDGSILLIDPLTHDRLPGAAFETVTVGADGTFISRYQLDGIAGTYEVRAYVQPWSGSWADEPFTSVTFTDLVTDFKQCANNDSSASLGDCVWTGNMLMLNNSRYHEGMSVPQRLLFDGVASTAGNVHTLEFTADATVGGAHAYDFLTSWDQAIATASTVPGIPVPFADLPGQACSASFGPPPGSLQTLCAALRTSPNSIDIDVPDDPFLDKDGSTQSRIDAYEASFGNRTVRIYSNAALSGGIALLSHSVPNGGSTGNSAIGYTLRWTSTGTAFLIEFGGHLAASGSGGIGSIGWGPGNGSSSINGNFRVGLNRLDGANINGSAVHKISNVQP